MMPAARWGPWVQRQPAWRLLAALTALHCAAVALFSSGFLLTRVELTQRSRCEDVGCLDHTGGMPVPRDPQQRSTTARQRCSDSRFRTAGDCASIDTSAAGRQECSGDAGASAADRQPDQLTDQEAAEAVQDSCCGPPHFNKTLWLIIDALRFDFVLHEPSAADVVIHQSDAALGLDPPPPHGPPPLPPHVQRMPELLSLARDWVRTAKFLQTAQASRASGSGRTGRTPVVKATTLQHDSAETARAGADDG